MTSYSSYSSYPTPKDEAERQSALASIGILDTPPEQSFDDITSLAAEMCETPVALVAFLDKDRQWFKARVLIPWNEMRRADSFCVHAIEREEPLVIPDTTTDPRFATNPHVTNDPSVRFYCGVPLRVGPGSAVGTLCVIDFRPRELTQKQIDMLRRLGRQIERELQHRIATNHPGVSAPPPMSAPLRGGDRVESYTIVRPMREGGVGALFEARTDDGQRVALKLLLGKWIEKDAALDRFVREARILRRLTSNHVCKLIDVGNLGPEQGRLPYLVLEYLEGTDLADLIASEKKLPWREATRILADACAGLGEAHALGVIHRDIKPSNIFLEGDNRIVKVLDFGVAKSEPFDPGSYHMTKAGSVLGTLAYMPPEQMIKPSEVGPQCDVWSIGATLYELVAGRPAFPGENDLAICSTVLMHDPPLVRTVAPDLPEALETLLAKTLSKDPAKRHATIAALEKDLRQLTA